MKFLLKIRHSLICIGILLALIQCQDLPPAEKATGAVDVTGANSQPANWQGCQTIYWGSSYGTSQNPFTTEITQTFTDVFSEFNNVGSSLRFEKASGSNVATVTITYVPASSFKTTPTETEGVLHYSIPTKGVSFYQIDANKRAIIYINGEFKLTTAQLKSVLLHQIGKIIGLPANSTDASSIMYPPDLNNPVKTLNTSDIVALKAKYGEDCPILLAANDNVSGGYDGSCGDIFYFTNLNNAIYQDAQVSQAVQKAIDVWNGAGSYVKFTATTDVSKAIVQIKFAAKSDFTTNTFTDAGNNYTLTAISKLAKGTTPNSAIIYLNQDFKWTDNALFRAITQQFGYYLGLTKSTDASSMMYQLYQSMKPLVALGKSDKTELAKRYGEACPLPIKIDKGTLKLEDIPKYFGKCNVSYDVVLPTALNIPTWANTALGDAFTAYNNANINLKFATKTADEKQANLTITFANAATVGKDNVAKIQYDDLVGLDSYNILINWEITTWTQQRLQSVMMHIMGNLLGLNQSPTNTNSIMFTTLKSISLNTSISTTEATTLRNLYNGFCNYTAPLYFSKINTQSVPNCIIRCTWGYSTGGFVTSNLTSNTDKINQYLNYPRLANYSTATNNNGIYFIYYLKKYNSYLAQLSDNYNFNSGKIPYNRLSYFAKATDGYNYTVYVNSEIPQLAQNNGAANNNLQMYYIGRMLGLDDSEDPTSIMYPYISTTLKSPNATDIQQIQKISAPNCAYTLSPDWKKLSLTNAAGSSNGFNFSINGKGYYGYNSYWYEFNPATNQTTLKGNNGQGSTSFFSFCNSTTKGYTFGGYKNVTYANGDTTYNFSKELWEFDPVANKWTQLADLPAQARQNPIMFHINGKIYVGGGYFSTFIGNGRTNTTVLSDFWEYDIATKKWTQKGNSTPNSCCSYSQWQSFTYQDKGYVMFSGKYVWAYDPTTDRWTTKSSYTGTYIGGGFFVIDNYAYVASPNALNEMYRYDIPNDRWTKITDPGIWGPLNVSNYFSLNGKGYLIGQPIGFGSQSNQVWEYQP